MYAFLLFAGAIAAEVTATVSLKLSDGFSRLLPSALVVAGYLVAFSLLAALLKTGMSIGVVYAIWSAAGVALVATIGAVFLGERFTWVMAAGLVLIVAGVVLVELGQAR